MEKFLYPPLSVPDWVASWRSMRQSLSGGCGFFCESVKSKGK